MDLTSLPLFSLMKSKLNYHSARQGVLAQNVANSDTPGYQTKDVAAPDFKSIMSGTSRLDRKNLPLAVTHPGHVANGNTGKGDFQSVKRASTYERNPNGNNVSLEEEMMLVSGNQAEYQKVLNIYKKSVDMFKTALGRPGSGG